jgi:hypothetical protein
MKTKQFMAQRISEQQQEIETLKSQLFYNNVKYIQLYDWMKSINEQLSALKSPKEEKNFENNINSPKNEIPNKEELNISGDLAKSLSIESHPVELNSEDYLDVRVCPKVGERVEKRNLNKILHIKDNILNLKEKNEHDEIILNLIKNENLDLKKDNEILKVDNLDKELSINRLKAEKFLLFNELNELTNALKMVDMESLNNFYKTNAKQMILGNKANMPSSLGLKYNILSVQNQLTYLLNTDLGVNKKLKELNNNNILKDNNVNTSPFKVSCGGSENGKVIKDELFASNFNLCVNNKLSNDYIDLNKYSKILQNYQSEYETICDNNLKRKSTIQY